MRVENILSEIDKLPIEERLILIEQTIKRLRSVAIYSLVTSAAEELADEYRINKELTIFTILDGLNFYEA